MKRQQLRQQVYLQLDTYIDATCASVSLNVIIKISKIFLLLFGQFKSLQGDIPRYSTKNYKVFFSKSLGYDFTKGLAVLSIPSEFIRSLIRSTSRTHKTNRFNRFSTGLTIMKSAIFLKLSGRFKSNSLRNCRRMVSGNYKKMNEQLLNMYLFCHVTVTRITIILCITFDKDIIKMKSNWNGCESITR